MQIRIFFAVPIYSFNKQPDYRTLFIHGKHAGLGKNFFMSNSSSAIISAVSVCPRRSASASKPVFFLHSSFFYLAVDLGYARVYLLYKCGTEVSVRQGAYQVIRLVGKLFLLPLQSPPKDFHFPRFGYPARAFQEVPICADFPLDTPKYFCQTSSSSAYP